MNDHTADKKFVCASCGSESAGTPGMCHGAERKEKETGRVCQMCSHEHRADGACDCGCK